MMRKKPKLSEEVHHIPGDGFRTKAAEAHTSHGKQATSLLQAPDQWQRCGEGFQLSTSKSECDKTPKVKSLTNKSLPSYSADGVTSFENKTAPQRAQRNFGQKWIQTEELFDGAGGSQYPEQRTTHDSLPKSASKTKASLASNTMTIEDADIDSIRWSESESDSEDVRKPTEACILSSSRGYKTKPTQKAKPQKKTQRTHTGRNLKPGAHESSDSDTGGVISASDSEEEGCVEAGEIPHLVSKSLSPTLEIECVGSPERNSLLSSDESSQAILQKESTSSHSSESPQKGKGSEVRTPSISSCVSSQSGPEIDVSPTKGGLRASEWAKQVKWETTPSKQRPPTPPEQADSAKKKKKFAKGGLAEQMSRILLREKSAIRMWQHHNTSDNTQQDNKSLVVQVRSLRPVYSLQLAECRVVKSPQSLQTVASTQCSVLLSPHACQHKAAIVPGATLCIFPPWQQLDTPNGHKVLLCTRYLVKSETSTSSYGQLMETTSATEDKESLCLSLTRVERGVWLCPCSSDAGLATSKCPASLFPFLPTSLLQRITPSKTSSPCSAGRTLHTVTGNEGAPKRTLTFDTLLESIEKARAGDKLLPNFQATVLRVFQEQQESGCKRLVLIEDSQGTVALLTGADHVSLNVEGNLCSFSGLHVLSRTNADRDPALFSAIAAAWLDKVKSGTPSVDSGSVVHSGSEDCYHTSQHLMQPPGFCYLLEVDRCGIDTLCGEDWMSVVTSTTPQHSTSPVFTTLAQTLQGQEQSQRVSIIGKVIYPNLKISSAQNGGEPSSATSASELFICDLSLQKTKHQGSKSPSTPKCESETEQCTESVSVCATSSAGGGTLPGYVKVQIQEDCVTDNIRCAVQKCKGFSPFVVLLRDVWYVSGAWLADRYSTVVALEGDSRETAAWQMQVDSDLCSLVRNCNVCLPGVSASTVPNELVSISGVIEGVDEKSAFSWEECDSCGSDQLATKSATQTLVCLGCRKTVTSPVQRMKMEVAVHSDTDPTVIVNVSLLQSTIEKLLPEPEDEEGYDVECVLHKPLGSVNCVITSVSHKTNGVMFSALQLPC